MPSHPYSVAKTDTYSPSPSTHTLAYPNICLSQKVEIKIKDICASCISVSLTPLMHILKLISLSILPFPVMFIWPPPPTSVHSAARLTHPFSQVFPTSGSLIVSLALPPPSSFTPTAAISDHHFPIAQSCAYLQSSKYHSMGLTPT